jgi:7-carboxy-7-deazaguanine synthase
MPHQIPADGSLLPLMEEFYTIQGEGFNTGKAAYFIRLGGCDVGCHWCDVKESWDASVHRLTPCSQIVEHAAAHPAKTIVVTGGEPGMYPLEPLTQALKSMQMNTHLETSGAYPITGTWDWVCLSPKKTMQPLAQNYSLANELKVIVHNKHDIQWALEQAGKVSPHCHLYVQPEWSKVSHMTPLIVDFVMENPQWKVSLQTHKYMHIP